jgi:hypothetical protein
MWPGREVAELTEKLIRMDDLIATMAPGGVFPFRQIAAPTAEADVNSKEETK